VLSVPWIGAVLLAGAVPGWNLRSVKALSRRHSHALHQPASLEIVYMGRNWPTPEQPMVPLD